MRRVTIDPRWAEYRRTGDVALRNELVACHMYVADRIAKLMLARIPRHVQADDVRSAAYLGMIRAAENFDPDRGVTFRAFCQLRVRGAIRDDLRARDWVPRMIREDNKKLGVALRALEIEHEREPLDSEVAERLGVSTGKARKMLAEHQPRAMLPFSVNTGPRYWDDEESDWAYEDYRSARPIEQFDARDEAAAVLRALPARSRRVVSMYYGDGLSMREVGAIIGISESRVSQILTKSYEILAEAARSAAERQGERPHRARQTCTA